MANPEHLAKLRKGVVTWNRWRERNTRVIPDLDAASLRKSSLIQADLHGANLRKASLSGADLREASLSGANLSEADLREASLIGANLIRANLRKASLRGADLGAAYLPGANLRKASFMEADLIGADLSGADLRNANFMEANLSGANLSGANLSGACLLSATLVGTNLEGADLTLCSVHGISVWDVKLKGAIQSNLVITHSNQSVIQVDNLEVAQFIYLLLNNEKIRDVIDTITSKVVLILGRFKPERKAVLDAIRDQLRHKDYLPVLFDFEKPTSKSLTGTVLTLANMARFIIADLTDPSSVPYELARVVPGTRVPVQTIVLEGQREFTMFVDLKEDYRWVLEPYRYTTIQTLLAELDQMVIAPAEAKAKELTRK